MIKSRSGLIYLSILLIFSSVLSANAQARSTIPNITDAKIEEFRTAGKIKGLQVAFVLEKEIILKKYGNPQGDQSWSHSDLLRIASVSKSFVAALFFKVAKANSLKSSDTLNHFFAADLLPQVDLTKVTIGDLLRHSSGIPDYFTNEFIQTILEQPGRVKTEEDALAAVKSLKPHFEAGTSISYSNTNYVLLGLILDSVAKKQGYAGHQELLRKLILNPANLASTFYENKEAGMYSSGKIVSGFLDGNDFLGVQQGYGLANGGLLSSVTDVASFFDSLFDPMSSIGVAHEMVPSEKENFGYGLYRMPTNRAFIGHTGEFAGYLSFAAHNPHTGVTIVGFANDSSELAKKEFGKLQEYLFNEFTSN